MSGVEEYVNNVLSILRIIIDDSKERFKRDGVFKVRPGYGYDKFYLDSIDGSYDMSLQGLIHYIMYEEGIYKKFLNSKQYSELELVIEKQPEGIYSPNDEDDNYEDVDDTLAIIYSKSIRFVGKTLIELGFNVEETFEEYLVEY